MDCKTIRFSVFHILSIHLITQCLREYLYFQFILIDHVKSYMEVFQATSWLRYSYEAAVITHFGSYGGTIGNKWPLLYNRISISSLNMDARNFVLLWTGIYNIVKASWESAPVDKDSSSPSGEEDLYIMTVSSLKGAFTCYEAWQEQAQSYDRIAILA